MSIKELDGLLSLLLEKKRKFEQEAAETNVQILLDFLHCLRRQKLEELNEVFAPEFICLCMLSCSISYFDAKAFFWKYLLVELL